jgi:hypothetical protein
MTAAQWDGLPQNPERDGWHWLHTKYGKHAMWWLAAARGWCGSDAASDACEMPPDEATDYYLRCEPCLTPAEVAALVDQARREERDACAAIADAGAPTQQWQDYHSEVAALRAEGQEAAAEAIAAAIRARSAT